MKTVRIGTRESRLAVVQAEMVAAHIRRHNPGLEVRLVTMKTTGDKVLDRTLDKVGGKGLFVKELDEALLRGDVDICVHSYKDMPAQLHPDLPVVAVGMREDPRDVLVLPAGGDSLDPAKPIGCSSQRRRVQLAQLFPGQPVEPVRGNVITRLKKLDDGLFGGLVLAAAGLRRLGLWDRASRVFETAELLPAGCQGALSIQGRAGEDHTYLQGLNDPDTAVCTAAERAFVRRLDCGCGAPVGAFARVEGGRVHLRAMVAGEDGRPRYDEGHADLDGADGLGLMLAESLLEGSVLR